MEWSRGHIIGHGSSATVFLATSTHSGCGGDVSAVKSSELSRSELLQREQRILSSLSSPYIVSYKGCDITMENNKLLYNLFMEYMPSGTLIQVTGRHDGRLNEPVIARHTRRVVQGLEYLHSNGLVHCDIKGSNILVGEDGAKIGDFGCAKLVAEAAAPISGTPMFMSPEVARGEDQGCPCDIWALGCTVVEMATGFAPWPNIADPVSVLYRVAYSGEVPEIPGFLSEQAKDFLGKCFRRNPKDRWTASQLLKHPFLGEFSSNVKQFQIQESSSSSPTSILEQGFWNSVEESESLGNLVHKSLVNSSDGRIRRLAVCSGEPSWKWDDEDWITTRGNEAGAEVEDSGIGGSETASTSDGLDLKDLEKNSVSSRISWDCFENYKCRDASVVVSSSLNFERGIAKMLLPSTFDFL